MRCTLLVLVAWLHGQVQQSIAACYDNTPDLSIDPASCETIASQVPSGVTQSSLLQVVKQTSQMSSAPAETKRKSHAPKAVFLYDHLPKAGGSFVRGVLTGPGSKVISPDHLRILEEPETLSEEDRQLAFTVGSVRNPCDYYVSCWAFSGKLPPATREHFLGKAPRNGVELYGASEELNTPEDQQRFGKWLRHIMPDGIVPGLATARLLWSYANQSVGNATKPEPTLQSVNLANNPFTEEDRLTYYRAAVSFDPSSVDCWIKTETIPEDLRRCLVAFEQQAGINVVNWQEFDKRIALHESKHNQTPSENSGKIEVWSKNSGHQPCHFYFDKSNTDYVLNSDFAIFSKFGYPSCCSS